MIIFGIVLVVVGLFLLIVVKTNLTPEERHELDEIRQRREQVSRELNRPLTERETAHAARLIALVLTPYGLMIAAGVVLILIGISPH